MTTISDIQKEFERIFVKPSKYQGTRFLIYEDGNLVGSRNATPQDIFDFFQSSIEELLESVVPEEKPDMTESELKSGWYWSGWANAVKQMRENIERVRDE